MVVFVLRVAWELFWGRLGGVEDGNGACGSSEWSCLVVGRTLTDFDRVVVQQDVGDDEGRPAQGREGQRDDDLKCNVCNVLWCVCALCLCVRVCMCAVCACVQCVCDLCVCALSFEL